MLIFRSRKAWLVAAGSVFALFEIVSAHPALADSLFLSDHSTIFNGGCGFFGCTSDSVTYNISSTHLLSRATAFHNPQAVSGFGNVSLIFYDAEDRRLGSTEALYGNGVMTFSSFTPFEVPPTFKVRASFTPNATPFFPYASKLDLYEPAASIKNLLQFASGGAALIPEGGTVSEPEVIFRVEFSSQFAESVNLQVEVRPAGISFTGADDGGLIESGVLTSGDLVLISKVFPDGLWRWRARFVDESGFAGPWVEFGEAGNSDFRVQVAPPPADPQIFAEQTDDSVVTHTLIDCDNRCADAGAASQVFVPLRSGSVKSVEVHTANFSTQSSNPETNDCYMRLVNRDTGAFIADSDNRFNGSACAGDMVFSFENSSPSLNEGTRYQWTFMWGTQNRTRLDFFGSPNNCIGFISGSFVFFVPCFVPLFAQFTEKLSLFLESVYLLKKYTWLNMLIVLLFITIPAYFTFLLFLWFKRKYISKSKTFFSIFFYPLFTGCSVGIWCDYITSSFRNFSMANWIGILRRQLKSGKRS